MAPRLIAFVIVEIGSLILATGGMVGWQMRSLPRDWSELVTLGSQIMGPPLCLFAAFYGNDFYNVRVVRNLFEFCQRLAWALGTTFALLLVLTWFGPLPFFGGAWVTSSLLLVLLYAGITVPLRWGFYTFGYCGLFAERILILGSGALAGKVARAIRQLTPLGYIIAGFVDDSENEKLWTTVRSLSPILGPLGRVEQIVEQFRPDRIIVALRERRNRMPLEILLKMHWAGVLVEDGVQVYERFSGKLAIESLTPGSLIFSTDFKKAKWERFLRRAANVLLALVGVMFLAPVFLGIAIAIRLDSQGPVFFIQKRAGLNGRVFRLVKFRTMHPATAADELHSVWRRDLESRVTRVGRWLRAFHLDELPQLFNILRGDMDLVGPRPEMSENITTMTEQIPYYALRMAIRPGVTGWAQVKYGYAVSQEDVAEKVRYDLYYIKYQSVWLDARIFLDTIKTTLLGRAALAGPDADTVRMPAPPGVNQTTVLASPKTPEKDTGATAA